MSSSSYQEKGCSLLYRLNREAAWLIGACKMHNWPQLKWEGSTAAANAASGSSAPGTSLKPFEL